MRPPGRFRASLTREINARGRRRRRRCGQARHYATRQCVIIKIAEPRGERSPVGREWGSRRVIYCAMRGKRPDFDLSGRWLSGAAGGMARSACATSMMSALGAPPLPRVTLDPASPPSAPPRPPAGRRFAARLPLRLGRRAFAARARLQLSPPQTARPPQGNLAAEASRSQGYREDRNPGRRSDRRAPTPEGQRRGAARNKTERLVQFVPHFSRRPWLRTS